MTCRRSEFLWLPRCATNPATCGTRTARRAGLRADTDATPAPTSFARYFSTFDRRTMAIETSTNTPRSQQGHLGCNASSVCGL